MANQRDRQVFGDEIESAKTRPRPKPARQTSPKPPDDRIDLLRVLASTKQPFVANETGHQRPFTSRSQFGRLRGPGRQLSGIAPAPLVGSTRPQPVRPDALSSPHQGAPTCDRFQATNLKPSLARLGHFRSLTMVSFPASHFSAETREGLQRTEGLSKSAECPLATVVPFGPFSTGRL